jgi:hypothetical protein
MITYSDRDGQSNLSGFPIRGQELQKMVESHLNPRLSREDVATEVPNPISGGMRQSWVAIMRDDGNNGGMVLLSQGLSIQLRYAKKDF